MPNEPSIPHQTIVDFILSGKTTTDAKAYFGFKSDNIANLRVWAAFRALGIKRPVYQEEKTCVFCGRTYLARSRNQKTCGAKECQLRVISDWQRQNKDKVKEALGRYKRTEKGRLSNLRMHATKRAKRLGNSEEKWQFALDEIKKSHRKLLYLSTRNSWEYRINHIQKIATLDRKFAHRSPRNIMSMPKRGIHTSATIGWQHAFRAIQTTLCQYVVRIHNSIWEDSVTKIQAAIRSGEKVRLWTRQKRHQ